MIITYIATKDIVDMITEKVLFHKGDELTLDNLNYLACEHDIFTPNVRPLVAEPKQIAKLVQFMRKQLVSEA